MSDVSIGTIRFRDVSRRYRVMLERNATAKEALLRRGRGRHHEVQALDGVDLDVEPGTALGVVGSNGAGKSTLLKLISGILPPDSGVITTSGRVVSLLELGAGFHPDFSGRENVFLNASIHGIGREEAEARMDDIVAFAGLEDFIDAPVRTYSSGMYARLGFAVASQLDPDILLLDEILAVGDQEFQNRCIARVAEFKRKGVTIVLVSHADGAVELVCDRAIWLADGKIRADGDVTSVLATYHRAADGGTMRRSGDADGEAPSTRQVEGPAAIAGARVVHGRIAGAPLTYGEPMRVIVDVEVREPQELVVGVEIRGIDGALMMARDSRTTERAPMLQPGVRRFVLDIDRLGLHDGRFLVSVGLSTQGYRHLDVLENAAEFTVLPSGPGAGPVRFPGEWMVTHPEARLQPLLGASRRAPGWQPGEDKPDTQAAADIFAGEWVSRLPVEGVRTGRHDLFDVPSLRWGLEKLGGVRGARVLEIGPLEGGHTHTLHREGAAEIVAIEADADAYLRSLIVKNELAIDTATVVHGEAVAYLRRHIATGAAPFDVALAAGVLYDLAHPVGALELLAKVTRSLFVWTMVFDEPLMRSNPVLSDRFPEEGRARRTYDGLEYELFRRDDYGGLDAGSWPANPDDPFDGARAWLSRDDLLAVLDRVGFDVIDVGCEEDNHQGNGAALALVARSRLIDGD